MKIGDLVKVKDCEGGPDSALALLDLRCECFFCAGRSNRIGVVLAPAPLNSYHVMFDCGEWRLDMFDEACGEVEVISEAISKATT